MKLDGVDEGVLIECGLGGQVSGVLQGGGPMSNQSGCLLFSR